MKRKIYDRINGREVYLYTIKKGNIEADICDLGARLNVLRVNGVDIILGFNSYKEYANSGSYAGATIGRVANRIAGGRFVLNGKPYFLNKNDGENHLHGGTIGFDKRLFEVVKQNTNSITLKYVSSDGEEKYPATLEFTVKFTVDNSALLIEYKAKSDNDTLWNPTCHAYFNLDGESGGDCRDNLLQINADFYTPVDSGLIPTGEKRAVNGTSYDFKALRRIGENFGSEELKFTNGYDNNFILLSEHAAHAESLKTGIKMDLYTDMPCLQLYTAGALKPCNGKAVAYREWAGFCLEAQFCPNAINMEGFDKPIIKKEEVKGCYIKLDFSKA
ncbi:MAG: galactose mutarotase [Ruminococcus flavefaciens]|nr:galactose mutarotase [Ruminococcus flavefaciens]